MEIFNFDKQKLVKMLALYLNNKPIFLAIIRVKEAVLFNSYLPYQFPIMDFGCGDGFFRKVSLTGIKQSIDVGLETDPKRAKLAKKSGIYSKVLTYNGKKIPTDDETFNIVLSNSVLEHVDNLKASLNEIYRVLKKGGRCYISVMLCDYENNLLGTQIIGRSYIKWMNHKAYHRNLLSLDQWKEYFIEAGFQVKKNICYLDKKNTMILDFLQYLSIPIIISQHNLPWLSKILCRISEMLFGNLIKRIIMNDSNKSCSACFFILTK